MLAGFEVQRTGKKSLQEGTKATLEATYWHLPVTPSHTALQKVRGYVDGQLLYGRK